MDRVSSLPANRGPTMPAVTYYNRIKETVTAPGTGTLTLLGAQPTYQAYTAKYSNGATVPYIIQDRSGTKWEIGTGTYNTGTITRTAPGVEDGSSGVGVLVDFSSGTQDVFAGTFASWLNERAGTSQANTFVGGQIIQGANGTALLIVRRSDAVYESMNFAIGSGVGVVSSTNCPIRIAGSTAVHGYIFDITQENDVGRQKLRFSTTSLQVVAGVQFCWNSSTNDINGGSPDTGLARDAAGAVRVTDGDSGAGKLVLATQEFSGSTLLSFTTPVGNTVATKILIPLFDPGAFNQLVALGIPSGGATTARAITLFDARTVAHQPTLMVLSPDELKVGGFTWNGSNTEFRVTSTRDLILSAGNPSGDFITVLDSIRCSYDTGSQTVRAMAVITSGHEVAIGGAEYDFITNTATVNTNGTEDDLFSRTVPGHTLGQVRRKLLARWSFDFVGHATATRQLRAYFAGTEVFDSGVLTHPSTWTGVLQVDVISVTSTAVRVTASFVPSGISLQPINVVTDITGLTLTGDNILKTTGTAADTGAAAGDITGRMGTILYFPNAIL